MTILVLGSLNIDHVYRVEHLVRPGETLSSSDYARYLGGKGANQAIALVRAGADVAFAGRIGADGVWLRDFLAEEGIDVTRIGEVDVATGHALIQVDDGGENAIILYGGANRSFQADEIPALLDGFGPEDRLLIQNEISAMPAIMAEAARRSIPIVFNPAPMERDVLDLPLETVSTLILNETEGEALAGSSDPDAILEILGRRYPESDIVLTLGAGGVRYAKRERRIEVTGEKVEVVDTTAAGDTFTGYFLASRIAGMDVEQALRRANRAAAICVTRPGAAPSIPRKNEL